jgi:pantothenate kinase
MNKSPKETKDLRIANFFRGDLFDIGNGKRDVRDRRGFVTSFDHKALGKLLLLHRFWQRWSIFEVFG